MLGLQQLKAQITPEIDTMRTPAVDSVLTAISSDSTAIALDSIGNPIIAAPALLFDSLGNPIIDSAFAKIDATEFEVRQTAKIAYSQDSLDAEVESYGQDSMRYDIKNNKVHLWGLSGKAYVKYQTITLTADYIVYDWTTNIVIAEGIKDSLGRGSGITKFEDGEETFDSKKLKYNFKTSKGIIYDAVSQYNDVYVRAGKGKFSGKGAEENQQDDHIFSEDCIFTTCNHPHPHFGIRSRKQKVVPNKVIVVGPSNVELGGVPTPLWLPFAFFPLKQQKSTGLIFPDNYEYSEQWGFGLKNIGWYFPISDYIDLQLTGDIYTRGTFGLHANSRYRKRYKYSGSFSLDFANQRVETSGSTRILNNQSFGVRWSHSQDATAHPTNKFGGSINLQTNNYQSQVENDAASVFQNNLSSNLTFNKIFPGKPYTMSASFNHSQNSQSRKVDVSFPNLNFNLRRVNPFKGKRKAGKPEQWYEKIGVTYSGNAQNKFSATDTTLFTRQTLDDAKFGVKHTVKVDASGFRFFKYFNFSTGASYDEIWNFKTIQKQFDPTPVVDTIWINLEQKIFSLDTVSYGTVDDNTKYGFKPLRTFSANANVRTEIFGLLQFKKGWLRGIRHVVKPNIGLSYRPDFTTDFWDYFEEVQQSTLQDVETLRYSIFDGGLYGTAPTGGQQMNLTYSISNLIEGKYYTKKDSTFNKFKVLDNINISGNYNLAADSMGWSLVNMTGNTSFLNGLTRLNLRATFDPYVLRDGQRQNELVWNDRKKLFRFSSGTASLNTGFTIKTLTDMFSGKAEKGGIKGGTKGRAKATINTQGGQESLLEMLGRFRFSHQINAGLNRMESNGILKDTFAITTHNIRLDGDIQLTDKWRISIKQISYDFKTKRLVYPYFTFYRDLHCWEMSMSWAPERNVFNFSLKVKPGSMDFLKVPYQRNRADGGQFSGF